MKADDNNIKKTVKAAGENTAVHSTVVEGSEMGEVKIHENVISSLVRKAIGGVEGVSRLAGSALVDNIAEIVGSRRMQSRAIAVELGEDNKVAIEVKVNLKFGYRVPEVAEVIQKNVICLVEDTTGMIVTKVNVLVQEIEEEVEPEDDEQIEDTEKSVDSVGVTLPIN